MVAIRWCAQCPSCCLQVLVPTTAAVGVLGNEAMDGEVHATEATGFVGLLHSVDGEFVGGVLLVLLHEPRGGDEHTARTAGWVEDAAVERFNDLGEQANNAARRVELASLLALGAGELAKEVFVNATEGIVIDTGGDLGDFLQ